MADTPAQAALRAAFASKVSVIPQTLTTEQQAQAQINIGGPFLPLSGGTVSGTITATSFNGPLTGNASTASQLSVARTISLAGDATGSITFDGSADATLNLSISSGAVTNDMLSANAVTFSKVNSADVATQSEAEAGTSNNAFMTPLRVAQAISAQGVSPEAYVIETWSSGSSWYRVWSDGFIEQGGFNTNTGGSFSITKITVTLNKAFSNTNYTFVRSDRIIYATSGTPNPAYFASFNQKTTTSVICPGDSDVIYDGFNWYACGY